MLSWCTFRKVLKVRVRDSSSNAPILFEFLSSLPTSRGDCFNYLVGMFWLVASVCSKSTVLKFSIIGYGSTSSLSVVFRLCRGFTNPVSAFFSGSMVVFVTFRLKLLRTICSWIGVAWVSLYVYWGLELPTGCSTINKRQFDAYVAFSFFLNVLRRSTWLLHHLSCDMVVQAKKTKTTEDCRKGKQVTSSSGKFNVAKQPRCHPCRWDAFVFKIVFLLRSFLTRENKPPYMYQLEIYWKLRNIVYIPHLGNNLSSKVYRFMRSLYPFTFKVPLKF